MQRSLELSRDAIRVYDGDMETDLAIHEIVLSCAEFVEAWTAHERESARSALAARRLEACGDWPVMARYR